MDEGLDALDRDTRERVISLFKESLEDTAIVNIGRPEAKDPFFTRVLHLIKDPHGRYFFPGISVALVSEAKAATEGLPCFSET
jgi:vitamin B12/bleomycin/antimicrobial peptide transport system ATP-binding/permease protein